MRKIFFNLFTIIFVTLFLFIIFLSFYGLETNRFNNLVENEIRDFNKNISVSLKKIKVKFDFKNINLYFETANPKIDFLESSIPIEKIKVYMNLRNFIENKKNIEEVQVNIQEVEYENLKSLIKTIKPSNLKSVLLNNIQEGSIKSNINLKLDKNLNVTSYEIDGYVRNLKSRINKFDIAKSNFIFTLN